MAPTQTFTARMLNVTPPSLARWRRLLAPGIGALALTTLVGCEGQTPQTNIDEVQIEVSDIVIPEARTLQKRAEAQEATVSLQSASSEGTANEGEAGECLAWETLEESYDQVTGDFTYRYSCAEGGEVAEVVTVGNDDGAGNGSYTQTSILRDGGEVVWTVDYVLLPDGATQESNGTSSEGETFHSISTYLADGSRIVDEEYHYNEGLYTVDGTYDANGLFAGTTSFDDPATAASPDYTLVHHENLDGSLQQIVDQTFEGYTQHYDYTLNADGSSIYAFATDDLATEASPDYEGAYNYNADGSGTGAYSQAFDDGSLLEVSDVFDAEGNLEQSWTFDDAATALALDQEGQLTYTVVELEDGALAYEGEGTVTYFLSDDESQVCSIIIDTDGNTELLGCES